MQHQWQGAITEIAFAPALSLRDDGLIVLTRFFCVYPSVGVRKMVADKTVLWIMFGVPFDAEKAGNEEGWLYN
jgi:hypothetical protein